jgi:hypothetical protein
MDEWVVVGFHCLLEEGAQSTIVPSTLLQSIRHSKLILPSKPSMIFDFRWCPSFPNNFVHARVN